MHPSVVLIVDDRQFMPRLRGLSSALNWSITENHGVPSADPYELLGVARDAPRKDIQKAYRRRAKEVHPDLNPGDGDALRKFQALSLAYGILGHEARRACFDRGEIDASGAERPRWRYHYDMAQARRRESTPEMP